MLKTEFLHSKNCVIFTEGVHRDNVKFHLRKYQYKRQKKYMRIAMIAAVIMMTLMMKQAIAL